MALGSSPSERPPPPPAPFRALPQSQSMSLGQSQNQSQFRPSYTSGYPHGVTPGMSQGAHGPPPPQYMQGSGSGSQWAPRPSSGGVSQWDSYPQSQSHVHPQNQAQNQPPNQNQSQSQSQNQWNSWGSKTSHRAFDSPASASASGQWRARSSNVSRKPFTASNVAQGQNYPYSQSQSQAHPQSQSYSHSQGQPQNYSQPPSQSQNQIGGMAGFPPPAPSNHYHSQYQSHQQPNIYQQQSHGYHQNPPVESFAAMSTNDDQQPYRRHTHHSQQHQQQHFQPQQHFQHHHSQQHISRSATPAAQLAPSGSAPVASRDPAHALGLYVTGFPHWLKVRHILEVFGEFGEISNAGIVYSSSSNDSHTRVYAYVDYAEPGFASKAIQMLSARHVYNMHAPLKMQFHFETINRDALGPSTASAVGSFGSATMERGGSELENLEDMDMMTIRIDNLPSDIEATRKTLEAQCALYGDIRRLDIIPKPAQDRAVGFLSFTTPQMAQVAHTALSTGLHFTMMEPLQVSFSRIQRRKPATSPSAGGDAPIVPRSIYIENMPADVDPAEFVTRLAKYGDIQTAAIIPRKGTNPFALVVYYAEKSAQEVFKHMTDKYWFNMREPLLIKHPDYCSIYIRNIPIHVTPSHVSQFFNQCGSIHDIRILSIKEGKDTTIAFVDFDSPESATRGLVIAHEARDPFGARGFSLRVEFTQTESPRKREDLQHTPSLQSSSIQQQPPSLSVSQHQGTSAATGIAPPPPPRSPSPPLSTPLHSQQLSEKGSYEAWGRVTSNEC